MKTDLGHMVHPLKKWTMGLKGNPELMLKRWWDKCGSIACDSDSCRLATVDIDLVITKAAL